MKNNSFLKDENLLTLLSINNFIIPEIQREYVWGLPKNKAVLKRFLENLKNQAPVCETCHSVHNAKEYNVGFLYSYKPPYASFDTHRYLDEFLIDGQQRLTTLFLLLLYLAMKENRLKDFFNIIRFDEFEKTCGFSYKVREVTQNFLMEYLSEIKNSITKDFRLEDFLPKEINGGYKLSARFFLNDYAQDVSVQGMLGALKTISDCFKTEAKYFDYVLISIKFWHFKTEITSQGEELYITMNSRGEKLSDNEEKKGMILPNDKLLDYGKKWEEWQDFFWKNRGKNQNADKGFNSFINCISAYKKRLQNQDKVLIVDIEKHFNNFKALKKRLENAKLQYQDYCAWIDDYYKKILGVFNDENINWDFDITDDNKSSQRNYAVLMWSWINLMEVQEATDISDILICRICRFFYVRFNNNNRSVSTIMATVLELIKNWKDDFSVLKEMTEDEKKKYGFLKNQSLKTESLIWKIEDLPLNLNGADLENINISHLVDFSNPVLEKNPDEYLTKVYNTFCILFPSDKKEIESQYEKKLKTLMLYFPGSNGKSFWKQQSPYYYHNYDCSEWRRIIRCSVFKDNIFKILVDSANISEKLKSLLEEKRKEFWTGKSLEDIQNITDEREQIIVYSCLGVNIWKYGNIAFYGNENSNRVFKSETDIYSLKRNFKSSSRLLWDSLKPDWKNHLEEMLDSYKN